MEKIYDAVVLHLQRQRDHEEALDLWKAIWSRYELRGPDAVKQLFAERLVAPNDKDRAVREEDDE